MHKPHEVAIACSPGQPKANDHAAAFRMGRQALSFGRGAGVQRESWGAAGRSAAALCAPPAAPEAGDHQAGMSKNQTAGSAYQHLAMGISSMLVV